MSDDQTGFRYVPKDPLDLNLMLTDPAWGKDNSGPVALDKLWTVLKIFNRDIRLGNLKDPEIKYCVHHLDLASDLIFSLPPEYLKPVMIEIERAAAVTETSQGRGGFLRKQQNTFTQEHRVNPLDEKKSFISGGKKQ